MNAVVWRLHRHQARFAAAAFAVAAAVILISGLRMAHTYHLALTACSATNSCANLTGTLFRGDGLIIDLVALSTLTLPGLLAMFWGVPLVAREMEEGTHVLAWTQSVTRRRWIATNLGWVLLAATALGAAMSALVTWWRMPENALYGRLGDFDIQGFVPVAYCVFAVALGIAAGVALKRVLPALAVTLGVLVAVRASIGIFLRPHLLSPITRTLPLADPRAALPGNPWVLSLHVVNAAGQFVDPSSPGAVPLACRGVPFDALLPCVADHGFRSLAVFQPDSRFWTLQSIESALFLLLTVPLVVFIYRRVGRGDA